MSMSSLSGFARNGISNCFEVEDEVSDDLSKV